MVCQLIDDAFSILIQCLLGFFALFSLCVKRITERPKRNFKVFVYDVSKQVVGSLYAHGLNILVAINVTSLNKNSEYNDQCMWYFVNFMVDVMLGLVLSWLLITLVNNTVRKMGLLTLVSGEYNIDNKGCLNRQYLFQLLIWICIITVTKIILFFAILIPFSDGLGKMGTAILKPVSNHDETELIVVMILVPLSLNILQFWIQDTFLKAETKVELPDNLDLYSDDSPSPPLSPQRPMISSAYLEIEDDDDNRDKNSDSDSDNGVTSIRDCVTL